MQSARDVAGEKPVITFAWLLYHKSNPVYADQLLQLPDLELMLRAPVDAGADGLIFWGHLKTRRDFDRQQIDLRRRVTPILMDLLRESGR